MRFSGLVLGAALSVACAASPPTKPVSAPVAAAPAPAPAAPQSAPDEVLLPPGVNPSAELFGYVRGAELRQSPIYRATMTGVGLIPLAKAALAELRSSCGFDPFEKLRWLTFSGALPAERGTHTAMIVLEANVGEDELFRCAQAVTKDYRLKPAIIVGKRALAHHQLGLIVDGSRVWIAERPTLEAAFAHGASGQHLPLPRSTYLYVAGVVPDVPDLQRATLSLAATPDVVVSLHGDSSSADGAALLVTRAEALRSALGSELNAMELPPEAKAWLGRALADVKIQQTGASVDSELRLPAAVAAALADGMLSGLKLYGVRQYMRDAKTAEARLTIANIAVALSKRVTNENLSRFARSAPRTPQQTPGAAALLVPQQAWQHPAWRDIGFSMAEKQYYSYEYEVARDGKSAVVRAVGDLDGDGVESRFELTISISEPGLAYITPAIHEQNPEE
jgi:hypothetical protein